MEVQIHTLGQFKNVIAHTDHDHISCMCPTIVWFIRLDWRIGEHWHTHRASHTCAFCYYECFSKPMNCCGFAGFDRQRCTTNIFEQTQWTHIEPKKNIYTHEVKMATWNNWFSWIEIYVFLSKQNCMQRALAVKPFRTQNYGRNERTCVSVCVCVWLIEVKTLKHVKCELIVIDIEHKNVKT